MDCKYKIYVNDVFVGEGDLFLTKVSSLYPNLKPGDLVKFVRKLDEQTDYKFAYEDWTGILYCKLFYNIVEDEIAKPKLTLIKENLWFKLYSIEGRKELIRYIINDYPGWEMLLGGIKEYKEEFYLKEDL